MLGNQAWETPWELFNKLDDRFKFTLDGSAEAHNTKCELFFSPEMNAHKQSPNDHTIFCNPPYSDVLPWATTFLRWAKENTVVVLLQDRTDVLWWKALVKDSLIPMQHVFLHKRVNFVGTITGNNRGAVVLAMGIGIAEGTDWAWDWRNGPYPL